jgi:hypothetical protein
VIKKACRSYNYDKLYLLSTTSIALSLNLTDFKETILDFSFVLSCINSGSIKNINIYYIAIIAIATTATMTVKATPAIISFPHPSGFVLWMLTWPLRLMAMYCPDAAASSPACV